MKSRRIGIMALIALMLLSSLGASGWLLTERHRVLSVERRLTIRPARMTHFLSLIHI